MEYVLLILVILSILCNIYIIYNNNKISNASNNYNMEKVLQEYNNNCLKMLSDYRVDLKEGFALSNKETFKELSEFKEKLNIQMQTTEKALKETLDSNLEKINKKVDEKLNEGFKDTNETFKNVIERLSKIDQAQKNIESLSSNIVSLQDVLSDKKTRGLFGEGQLYQILANAFGENSDIYQKQKSFSNGNIVDAAVKASDKEWLSIDSKFPLENYNRLIDKTLSSLEREKASKDFERDVKKHIDDISNKYIIEGETVEQAIMFIPAESIFAEILAYHKDLVNYAYDRKVNFTSPTTLMAMLRVIYFVDRDRKKSEQTVYLFEQLKALGIEFKRYSERWNKLEKELTSVNKSVLEVSNTSKKINNKFNKINSGNVEELSEGDNATYEGVD